MVLVDKNNKPIQPGIYHGEGSEYYGQKYIGYIESVGGNFRSDFEQIRTICGMGNAYDFELAKLERVDNPLEFVRELQRLYSFDDELVIFMKSLIFDLIKDKIPKDRLEAILAGS